jgi:hypothetical protein
MKLKKFGGKNPTQLEFPKNLAAWMTDQGLLSLALDSTQQVLWQGKDKLPLSGACRPQMLLTLLTYCYSSGVYSTQDILQAVQHNPVARYICAHHFPDDAVLRRFRRNYRPQLEQALRWVILQAWAARLDEAETEFLGYEWFSSYLEVQLDGVVQARLELAILLDGVEND